MEKLKFCPERHIYTWGGGRVPSVTQVLAEASLVDLSHVSADVLDRASKFGTAVHSATQFYDQGLLDETTLDDALKPYLGGWIKFLKETSFVIAEIEGQGYSEKYKFAGTFDRVGLLNGKRTLLDIKSGTSLPRNIALQTAGYKILYDEGKKKSEQIKQRCCVQLKENGKYNMVFYDKRTDEKVFLAALAITNWKRG